MVDMKVCVAVDCMGGDYGAVVTVPAAAGFLRRYPNASVILVGRPEAIEAGRQCFEEFGERVKIQPASQVVDMDESPQVAMRAKKDSSLRVAIDLVKSGDANAVVSAGNTGALMAIARFVLKTLPGIDRPAIATVLPTINGRVWVLDLGANVDCSAQNLLQFAVMGSMLSATVERVERPLVGLLNIGEEAIKGNEIVKQAAELLRQSDLNFYGNVEGDKVYQGVVDVVVCDGFVGNVMLKTTEGLAQMLGAFLREEFSRGLLSRLSALVALPALKRFKGRLDHRRYNGASLVGLKGVVFKSHGSADAFAFEQAIARAAEAAASALPERIAQRMAAQAEALATLQPGDDTAGE